MAFPRKEFLKLGLVGGAGLALSSGASASSPWGRARTTGNLLRSQAQLPKPFMIPLFVPSVLKPVRTDSWARGARAPTDSYEITHKEGKVEILPALTTALWGYDEIFPGSTIESRSGRKIVVRNHNELPAPVTTHLHGGRTPPGSDGYPTDLILPRSSSSHTHHEHPAHPAWSFHRGSKDYVYPLEQRAATLWYHDHRMDFTGPQIWRGLAGFHIVHDDVEDALPLPKEKKDVPLMLCDRGFGEGGSFLYPSLDPSLQGTDDLAKMAIWSQDSLDYACGHAQRKLIWLLEAVRGEIKLEDALLALPLGEHLSGSERGISSGRGKIMHKNQKVAEMAVDDLARQVGVHAKRTRLPFEEVLKGVLETEDGRQLSEPRDGPHRDKKADQGQEEPTNLSSNSTRHVIEGSYAREGL
jgi:hypothetical protein